MAGPPVADPDPMRTHDPQTRPPGPRRLPRAAAWVAACAILLAGGAGCRNARGGWLRGGGGGSGDGIARHDPLLGGARIPPQNLPIPGKDAYGSRGTRDPLLVSPTGRDDHDRKATQQNPDNPPNTKAGGSAARSRDSREPWRPGLEATNGALAAGLRPDDSVLSIGDRRPVGATASRPVPLRPRAEPAPAAVSAPAGIESYTAVLQHLGAKWDGPVREGDVFVMRADVPVSADSPGLLRRYEGAGPTPAAAANQLVEQVRGDRDGR